MSDTDLAGVLRNLVQECVKGMKPTDMMTGTVLAVNPLSVQPDISMPPIPAAGLTVTDAVREKKVTAPVQGGEGGTVTVVINEALRAGDKVLMLRVSKGQRYIILSRL